MAAFEGSYSSLLQGVSQQLPKMRLPGQVTAQINMLSDPVTGPRRRPGAEWSFSLPAPGSTSSSLKAWETDIGGALIHVIACSNTGRVFVLNSQYELQATLTSTYLVAPTVRELRGATVGSEMFLLNTSVKPAATPNAAGISPARQGFAFVVAGTFSKTFDITIKTNAGTVTGTYTTPAASATDAATAALPENIAESLLTSLNTAGALTTLGVTITREGPYLYFLGGTSTTSLVVSSTSGTVYVTTSGASKVRLEGNLPARLPAGADGYVVAVGQQKSLVYYTYDATSVSWQEVGAWDSPTTITGMPISLRQVGGVWQLVQSSFEGRLAGAEDTNPLPAFVEAGITGIGSYQGRLVLLAGSQVCLSSSKSPRRFLRSTVTSLLDEDPIGIGASANSSASYEYAVPFQRDLLLFSSKYQALIPGSNQAISPRTATVLITSTFSADMGAEPVPIGRTLLYPAPLSSDFFGVLEMISSQYTDSQYVSNQATAHLPKYMAGGCRFSASSPVASLVCFGQTRNTQDTIIYQYTWSGDEKVQQAWHSWKFPFSVATSYFSGEVLNFLFVSGDTLVGARVDPKQGLVSEEGSRRPYLDLYVPVTVVDRAFTVPAWLMQFTGGVGLVLSQVVGELAGDEVGIESVAPDGTARTVRSFTAGQLYLGLRYTSVFSPTPPIMLDSNGAKIDSAKLTVLRFGLNTQNSAEYTVAMRDDRRPLYDQSVGTLRWASSALELGSARVAGIGRAIVPSRANADTVVMQASTESTGELNITGIDYVCRFNQKIRRR